jgi:hypothetical protein
LRQLLRLVIAVAIPVAVAAAAGALTVFVAGPAGLISCVPPAPPANPEPFPRWVLVAGLPALIAGLVGLFFALAAERMLVRLVGVLLSLALAAATFYAVYSYLPANCLT